MKILIFCLIFWLDFFFTSRY